MRDSSRIGPKNESRRFIEKKKLDRLEMYGTSTSKIELCPSH